MKILGTGLTGLVGSRIVELLKNKYEFENLSRSSGVDILDKNQILDRIRNSNAQVVFHLAGKANVDGCELDKSLGEEGESWKVNVEGTRNVADACSKTNKKIIYISTDFVFDGTPKSTYLASEASTLAPARSVSTGQAKEYTEDDLPNPINWYGQTKYEGEKIVKELKTPWIISRIAYPYRANFTKLDFFRTILGQLRKGESVVAITDHIFTPTYIDDIASAFDILIEKNSQGIFHVVGSQHLTPFDASFLIAKEFGLDSFKITKTTRAEFFNNRAPRPFQLALKNDKIEKLGIRMKSFEEGLRDVEKQISNF